MPVLGVCLMCKIFVGLKVIELLVISVYFYCFKSEFVILIHLYAIKVFM